jgi:hypothetical protein
VESRPASRPGNGERRRTHLAEDNALSDSHDIIQAAQRIVFLLLAVTFQVQLLDSIHRDVLALEEDLVGLGRDAFGKTADFVGKGGREEHVLGGPGEHTGHIQLLHF